MAQSYIMYSQK